MQFFVEEKMSCLWPDFEEGEKIFVNKFYQKV
jgi:hypothetical protein